MHSEKVLWAYQIMLVANDALAVTTSQRLIRLYDDEFVFELDTGASTSLIAPSLVKQFGLPQAGRSQTISGIGGVQQATPVTISNWQTGPIRLPATTIVSASMPLERGSGLDGLIGSDIWSRFGKFTLDYSSGTLTVYKQIALSASA
jgi:predicted aspartyl protease